MTSIPVIRPEAPSDYDTVRRINEAAFGQPNEAKLVDVLRESVDPCISLVAELDDAIVGHIMFSPVTVESEGESWTAMGLAPMAVTPENQRQGIGSALVRSGLAECQRIEQPIVFVLGHPEYYPRFGFHPAPPLGLLSEYDVPDDVFMVVELTPDTLAGRIGLIKYAPAFANL